MEPYVGEIRIFAGNYAPQGWLLCDGASIRPDRFATLFSLIGTIYGGDGHTSFNVPDLRGRAPVQWGQGQGLSGYEIGKKAGAEKINLTVQQLPAHNHTINAKVSGNQSDPNGHFPSTALDSAGTGVSSWGDVKDAVMNKATIDATGAGEAVNITSPILAVTYIIAYEGIYPPTP